MSEIHEKLRKLLALARQGVGGEKANAQSMLEALMKKHGVSLAELGEDVRELQWFKPAPGKFEKKLMIQVIAAVCGPVSTWKNPGRKRQIGVEVTKAEFIEIELRYSAYVTVMQKEMFISYRAFVHTNKIFHADAPTMNESEVDREELNRLAMAMMGMQPAAIRLQLPQRFSMKGPTA